MDAPRTDAIREMDELRLEIAELRASRTRLLLAADEERRSIERGLHDGLQQRLIGLATDVELASASIETDPDAAMRHLAEVRRGVRHVLEQARTLAHRIYPPLEAGGLAAVLRLAAASANVRPQIEVTIGSSVPTEIVGAVYFCCLDVLEGAAGAATTISVREEAGGLAFEIVTDGEMDEGPSSIRDRAEALGGSVRIRSEPGPRTIWTGFLPLER